MTNVARMILNDLPISNTINEKIEFIKASKLDYKDFNNFKITLNSFENFSPSERLSNEEYKKQINARIESLLKFLNDLENKIKEAELPLQNQSLDNESANGLTNSNDETFLQKNENLNDRSLFHIVMTKFSILSNKEENTEQEVGELLGEFSEFLLNAENLSQDEFELLKEAKQSLAEYYLSFKEQENLQEDNTNNTQETKITLIPQEEIEQLQDLGMLEKDETSQTQQSENSLENSQESHLKDFPTQDENVRDEIYLQVDKDMLLELYKEFHLEDSYDSNLTPKTINQLCNIILNQGNFEHYYRQPLVDSDNLIITFKDLFSKAYKSIIHYEIEEKPAYESDNMDFSTYNAINNNENFKDKLQNFLYNEIMIYLNKKYYHNFNLDEALDLIVNKTSPINTQELKQIQELINEKLEIHHIKKPSSPFDENNVEQLKDFLYCIKSFEALQNKLNDLNMKLDDKIGEYSLGGVHIMEKIKNNMPFMNLSANALFFAQKYEEAKSVKELNEIYSSYKKASASMSSDNGLAVGNVITFRHTETYILEALYWQFQRKFEKQRELEKEKANSYQFAPSSQAKSNDNFNMPQEKTENNNPQNKAQNSLFEPEELQSSEIAVKKRKR